jgi:hypothetical protein
MFLSIDPKPSTSEMRAGYRTRYFRVDEDQVSLPLAHCGNGSIWSHYDVEFRTVCSSFLGILQK